jgi:hypothetical protein
MGTEFIEKAAPSFTKSWDRARVRLGTADLFTRQPEASARTAAAAISPGIALRPGEFVVVERDGDTLIALRQQTIVARFVDPPRSLTKAVEDSCGIARGTVEDVHAISSIAEISLC